MAPAIRPEIAAARLAREELSVALTEPFSDILTLIEEDAGVPVGVLALPEGFAGVMKRARGRAFIFVNSTEAPVRQRFTLAHEYGHYKLGHGTVFDRDADIFGRHPQEVSANAFAAEFLAPRPAVHAWLERRGDPEIDLELVVRLACHFGISARAARIRLETVGLLKRGKRALDEAIALGEHKDLQYRLNLPDMQDSLTAIKTLPRLPRVTQQQAMSIYEAGLLDVAQIAERTLQQPDVVAEQFAGITPVEADPDF
jgi:Zn-dependent peptidase ImmA (M78 family)